MPNHPLLQPFRPPRDYERHDSAVDGVSVWAPIPVEDADTDARAGAYRCEQCGAGVGFEVAAGAVACTFCGHVAQSAVSQVGTGAAQEVFTDAAISVAEQTWELHRKELHCESCGVDIQIEEGALTAQCGFCGSGQVLVREGLVSGLRPHAVVPFKVEGQALRERIDAWLQRGWMHPADLRKSASVERFVGVYVPWWTFSARIESTWKAQVGVKKTKRVYVDGEWHTKTVIEWQWWDGEAESVLSDWLVLGTSRIAANLAERIREYDLDELVEYTPDVLAGWQAQAFDRGLMEAWDLGRAAMRTRARADCRRAIHKDKVRHLSVTADFEEERWRYVLLPVHLTAYAYNGETFHVLVNGQTGALAGQKPVVWSRITIASVACFVPGLLLGLISLPLMLVGVGFITIFIALLLLIAGGLGAMWLVKTARDAEARP